MTNQVALVTGVGGPAGRAVSEYFEAVGIPFWCADMRPLNESRNFRVLPPASQAEFVSALDHLVDEARIGLLIPTVTEELPKVAEYREPIRRKNCALFVSPPEAIRIANDKWETFRALVALGVPVPCSYSGESREELLEMVPFPMLSKPRFGRGGRGISIHRSTTDLPQCLSAERIFQEFLPAEEYDVNLFSDPGEDAAVAVVLRKTVLKDGLVGNALEVEPVQDPEVAELAIAAARVLGLEGPIDIDIRRGSDGRARILEINARVGANVRAAEEILVAMVTNWRDMQ